MTIVEAILKILRDHNKPMTASEIHELIVAEGLFTFAAQDPVSIVRTRLREHCVDIDLKKSSSKRFFLTDGKQGKNVKFSLCKDSEIAVER